jgi:NAD-dependent dihydropyrimidine dehydrogenase PreA subunit
MATRKVIKINENLCNGCGMCVPSCAEGAIQIIDGKARLVSEKYCDGLGACLGECPQGALSFEEREAEEFDEMAAMEHVRTTGHVSTQLAKPHAPRVHGGGCPGSRMFDFRSETAEEPAGDVPKLRSELRQWPVKLNLVNPAAPYFQDADLVLSADCAAFAYASFHPDYLKGKALAIGCPKFDDVAAYIEKLRAIIEEGGIKSISVVHMEVPCCLGLLYAAEQAIRASGKEIPLESVVIGIRGGVKEPSIFSRV